MLFRSFFGVQRRFLFSPLLAQSSSLYKGGVLFTVVRAGKRRDVVAAGGRYDALLKHFANPSTASTAPLHGVGVQMAVGKLTLGLSKYQEVQVPKLLSRTEEERSFGLYTPRRCDVYVASTPGLLETRMEICRELWAHNIAADLQYEHATYDTPESAAATAAAMATMVEPRRFRIPLPWRSPPRREPQKQPGSTRRGRGRQDPPPIPSPTANPPPP